MVTDPPTPASRGTKTVQEGSGRSSVNEDAVLDEAIRRADDLLVQSLRSEESSRRRRRLRWVVIPIGAIIMLAGVYKLALITGIIAQVAPAVSAPEGEGGAPSAAVAEESAADAARQGWINWQQGKPAKAEEHFKQAVKLDPSLVNAWNGMGWAQMNQGKVDDAEASFKKTVELEPGHAGAENGLGQIYLARRDYDKAEKHLLISGKTADANAAWYGLARVYLLRSQWDKAAEYAQKLVDVGQEEAKPLLDAAKAKQISAALRRQITPAAAPARKPAATKSDAPAVGDASVQKGWMQLNKGQASQAVATFKALLDRDPNDVSALNGLGWAYLRTPDGKENAKAAFQSAIKAAPDSAAGAYNGLAVLLKNEGKVDEAIALWQKLTEISPGASAGTYGLATTYIERNQPDKAIPLLEQLVDSEPTNAEFKQLLAKAKATVTK